MKIVLKNAMLHEKTHPLHHTLVDILVVDQTVEKIIPAGMETMSSDVEIIDIDKQYCSAGWIDLHVHCYVGDNAIGTDADSMGVAKGVPIIVDAGTAGAEKIDDFYAYAQKQQTIIFSFINVAKTGLNTLHELVDMENIDLEKLREKIQAHKSFVVGIKVRESGSIVGENDVLPLIEAQKVSKELQVPIMVHIGNKPPLLEDILANMKQGDIITHCYHGKTDVNIINEETENIHDFVWEAKEKDVLFDVGHGSDSFAFQIAKEAIHQGFKADTISTDMYKKNMVEPVQSLALTMGKIVQAGMTIDEVLDRVTCNAAAAIHKEDIYGTIAEGREAVFTIFEEKDVPKKVLDSMGNEFVIEKQILPTASFIKDKLINVKQ